MKDQHDYPSIEYAAKVIKKIQYITLATASNKNIPWCTPVYSAYDPSDLSFYWLSSPDSVHSKNIHHQPHIGITIYDSTVPEGTGGGVYFAAKSTILKDEADVICAQKLCLERVNKPTRDHRPYMQDDSLRRYYKATPEKVWVNGISLVGDIWVDMRKELDLNELTKYMKP